MIFDAVKAKNLADIKQAISNNPNCINLQTVRGNTPLYVSIYARDLNIVRFLLESGADIYHQNAGGHTPLLFACAVYIKAKNESKASEELSIYKQIIEVLLEHESSFRKINSNKPLLKNIPNLFEDTLETYVKSKDPDFYDWLEAKFKQYSAAIATANYKEDSSSQPQLRSRKPLASATVIQTQQTVNDQTEPGPPRTGTLLHPLMAVLFKAFYSKSGPSVQEDGLNKTH